MEEWCEEEKKKAMERVGEERQSREKKKRRDRLRERHSIYQNQYFAHHGYLSFMRGKGGGGKNIVYGGHHVVLCTPYILYKIDNIFPNIVCVSIYYHNLI